MELLVTRMFPLDGDGTEKQQKLMVCSTLEGETMHEFSKCTGTQGKRVIYDAVKQGRHNSENQNIFLVKKTKAHDKKRPSRSATSATTRAQATLRRTSSKTQPPCASAGVWARWYLDEACPEAVTPEGQHNATEWAHLL
ncbi:hypothetical protein PRIC1_012568 [Phytophthora ramorum]|nr:hypothetical protein KRP22_15068 [Phytophthora ramorum]